MFKTVDIKPNIILHGADDSRGARYIQLTKAQEVFVNYSRFVVYRTIPLTKTMLGIFAFEFNLN